MRGHIRKRGSTYSIVVDIGRDENGKRKQKWFSGYKKEKDAEKALPEILNKIMKGEIIDNDRILTSEYLKEWLQTTEPHVSKRTYLFYEDIVERVLIPLFGNIVLKKLTSLEIERKLIKVMKDKNLSPYTVKHYYDVLNIALNKAVKDWQIISRNPCDGVTPPGKKTKVANNVLSLEQVSVLLNYTINSQFKVMYLPIVLALDCGLRRGEILGLKWNNIDFDSEIIHVENNLQKVGNELQLLPTKTVLSQRSVKMSKHLTKILKFYKEKQSKLKEELGDKYVGNGFVCCWDDGQPLKPDYVTHTFKKILKKCNLPDIRFHDLRHTHATLLLLKGVNPKIVSERLGHSSVEITLDTYSHVLPDIQQEAVEAIDELYEVFFKQTNNNSK